MKTIDPGLNQWKHIQEVKTTKYFYFHQDHDHDTEHCQQLQDKIKALIRSGSLGKYIQSWSGSFIDIQPCNKFNEGQSNHPINGAINMITGISQVEWQSEEPSPKRQCTKEIIFSDDDLQGVQTFDDDTIIINMIIANYDVRRILVDNGSSTDGCFMMIFS